MGQSTGVLQLLVLRYTHAHSMTLKSRRDYNMRKTYLGYVCLVNNIIYIVQTSSTNVKLFIYL